MLNGERGARSSYNSAQGMTLQNVLLLVGDGREDERNNEGWLVIRHRFYSSCTEIGWKRSEEWQESEEKKKDFAPNVIIHFEPFCLDDFP